MRRPSVSPSKSHREMLGRLAANVRALREARSWTQAEAAWACKLAGFTYQCVEAGEKGMTTATLAALCDGFEVDALALFQAAEAPAARPRGRPRGKTRGDASAADPEEPARDPPPRARRS